MRFDSVLACFSMCWLFFTFFKITCHVFLLSENEMYSCSCQQICYFIFTYYLVTTTFLWWWNCLLLNCHINFVKIGCNYKFWRSILCDAQGTSQLITNLFRYMYQKMLSQIPFRSGTYWGHISIIHMLHVMHFLFFFYMAGRMAIFTFIPVKKWHQFDFDICLHLIQILIHFDQIKVTHYTIFSLQYLLSYDIIHIICRNFPAHARWHCFMEFKDIYRICPLHLIHNFYSFSYNESYTIYTIFSLQYLLSYDIIHIAFTKFTVILPFHLYKRPRAVALVSSTCVDKTTKIITEFTRKDPFLHLKQAN